MAIEEWVAETPLEGATQRDGYSEYQQQNRASSVRNKGRGRRRRRVELTLATHLCELEADDTGCILFIHGINKLGFDSPDILRDYFEGFGPVSKVRVSGHHEKSTTSGVSVRLRPSGIGLVLMENAVDAANAIAHGALHSVNGVEIRVRAFQARENHQDETYAATDARYIL